MDQRLTDALEFANYRLTLQAHRQNIQARVEAALLVSFNNAIFRATPELISFVSVQAIRSTDPLYVDDHNGNVHLIDDRDGFLDALIKAYDTAQSMKYQEQQKLRSARATGKIVDL